MRFAHWVSLAVAFVLAIRTADDCRAAVPAAETLMPSTSKAFVAVGSVDQLRESFNKTQMGHLLADPAMQPFLDSFQKQMEDKWTQTHRKLGITWKDLENVPSGEVSLAVIRQSEKEVATALVADVTGRPDQAKALVEKVNRNLAAQKAVKSTRTVHNALLTILDVPKQGEQAAHQVAYALTETLLVTADNAAAVEGILARLAGAKNDSLATVPAFDASMKRVRLAAEELAPHARWFIDPFGYADVVRLIQTAEKPRAKGTDMLKILKDQGFTAVRGMGGFVNFAVEQYEMLHRSFIHAPGHDAGSERFTLAARMLDFPNGGEFGPPTWVPRDVASYMAINLNVPNAFESSKTLVNQIVGDEVFEEVLEQIRDDPHGPRIDVRKEAISHLKNRVTIISDLQLPITPKSERILVAIETDDEASLIRTLEKQFKDDPEFRRREINGHVVWEMIDEATELPMVTIENAPSFGTIAPPIEDEDEDEKVMLPNSAMTVAHGQVMFATHIDILIKVLSDESERGKLVDSADYNRVKAELASLKLPQQSIELFTRTDDAYQGLYELLKQGRMPEAESLMGRILNSLLNDNKEGALRTQQIDGSKLPEYDLVRRYLGPAGMTLTTEETGWFMTGFTLAKEIPLTAGAIQTPATPPARDDAR